jgi:hypothetical protein
MFPSAAIAELRGPQSVNNPNGALRILDVAQDLFAITGRNPVVDPGNML